MNRTPELNLRAFIAASDAGWEARTAARNDLGFLLAELARKDEVLRLVADDASSYSGALGTFPWERDSLFAALTRIAETAEAALGEQP